MFEKGRRRESKGLAVLYFIIGLIILLIILGVIYFALVKLDYSDQLADPNAEVRSYVSATVEPTVTEKSEAEDDAFALDEDEDDLGLADVEDGDTAGELTLEGEVEEGVPLDDAELDLDDGEDFADSPEVIQTATPAPTPVPTRVPTPVPAPTKVPKKKISKSRTGNVKLPNRPSSNGVIGITQCEVYAANKNSVMRLAGYGYVNSAKFNGKKAQSYMVVTQRSNGKMIVYKLKMKKGISGRPHPKAKCKNSSNSDFQMYIDVSKFRDDIYSLALVIGYTPKGGKGTTYAYYPFSSDVTFTVLDGRVVTRVPTVR